jgi:hypothetical protein
MCSRHTMIIGIGYAISVVGGAYGDLVYSDVFLWCLHR